ncbi:unnamed protein product [Camellia sinensis]
MRLHSSSRYLLHRPSPPPSRVCPLFRRPSCQPSGVCPLLHHSAFAVSFGICRSVRRSSPSPSDVFSFLYRPASSSDLDFDVPFEMEIDSNRGYTCIKTTYTSFGDDFNAKVYENSTIHK